MTERETVQARQQQTWAAGDYAMIVDATVLASELLCDAVDLRAGRTVFYPGSRPSEFQPSSG